MKRKKNKTKNQNHQMLKKQKTKQLKPLDTGTCVWMSPFLRAKELDAVALIILIQSVSSPPHTWCPRVPLSVSPPCICICICACILAIISCMRRSSASFSSKIWSLFMSSFSTFLREKKKLQF